MKKLLIAAWAMILAWPAMAQAPKPQPPPAYPTIVFAPSQTDKVKVIDGDTFWIGIHQIRLLGVDAVEVDQDCKGKKVNKAQSCHQDTINFLAPLLNAPGLRCEVKRGYQGDPEMSYGRYMAVCYSGQTEINQLMVERGWAFASNKPAGERYKQLEKTARKARLGIHAFDCVEPWVWRDEKNKGKCSCEDQ